MLDFIILSILIIIRMGLNEIVFRLVVQKAQKGKSVWLSHGSPATSALFDEETEEEDVLKVEEDCLSPGRDDVKEDLQAASSPPQALGNIPDVAG